MKTIKIAVCDDELIIANQLKIMIENTLIKMGQSFLVDCFSSGKEMVKKSIGYDVIFLDIEMPSLDGIEVGKRIRRNGVESKIVIAAGRTERFKEVFTFQAFRYITKPYEALELEETLQSILESNICGERMEVFQNRNSYNISVNDISYVEAVEGYCEVHVIRNKCFRRNITLSKLESELNANIFQRVSRNFIINMNRINHYSNGVIHIDDGTIEVTRRRKKLFEQKYIEFDLRYRG